MLTDHRFQVEADYRRIAQRRAQADHWGHWLSELRLWDWFYTVTFRDELRAKPHVIKDIKRWLLDVTEMGGQNPSWALAEEWGRAGGRYHVHGLVAGVQGVSRRFAWSEAFRRFGRSQVVPCERSSAAAFYAAKYASKALGNVWLGGSGFDTLCGGEQQLTLQ